MKTLIGIIAIIYLLSFNSKAQSLSSTKIHFLNAAVFGTELKTTIDPKKPIQIKPGTWVVVKPIGDSINFVIDNKSYPLHFEPNKQYYFVIQIGSSSRPVITEKTEREFILTAAFESARGPEEYILSKAVN